MLLIKGRGLKKCWGREECSTQLGCLFLPSFTLVLLLELEDVRVAWWALCPILTEFIRAVGVPRSPIAGLSSHFLEQGPGSEDGSFHPDMGKEL